MFQEAKKVLKIIFVFQDQKEHKNVKDVYIEDFKDQIDIEVEVIVYRNL